MTVQVRKWSDHVFGLYVEDGLFGRRVGLIDLRDNDENPSDISVSTSGVDTGQRYDKCARRERANAQTAGRLDPESRSEPSLDVTRTPRQTRVTNPTAGAK